MRSDKKPVSQFSLLLQKRFLPFFVTQFLGAFNDNVFKNSLIILIAFSSAVIPEDEIDLMTNLSAGLFILPFFLFSAMAGQLIDKYEKSLSIRWIKFFEIVIMLCAAIALYFDALYVLIAILFVMGLQSTFFGPAKYSYIPQHLDADELVAGNALVQGGTFVAILVGTMMGGILVTFDGGVDYLAAFIVLIALAGFVFSLSIPVTPSLAPELKVNWNPFTESWRNLVFLYRQHTIFVFVLGISWFWFLGATYLVQLPNYTKTILGGNEQVVTLLLTTFTISVGAGALLCNRLSKGKVEMALVPFGALGLSAFGIDLFFSQPVPVILAVEELMTAGVFIQSEGALRVIFDIACIGIFSGFYIVPLFALVQLKSDPSHLSRVIAGNNILNALFMVVASVMAIFLLGSGFSISQLFLIISLLNIVVATGLFLYEPAFVIRLLVWLRLRPVT